jgi:hypothetical protein
MAVRGELPSFALPQTAILSAIDSTGEPLP